MYSLTVLMTKYVKAHVAFTIFRLNMLLFLSKKKKNNQLGAISLSQNLRLHWDLAEPELYSSN